jgi:hypothetical protein
MMKNNKFDILNNSDEELNINDTKDNDTKDNDKILINSLSKPLSKTNIKENFLNKEKILINSWSKPLSKTNIKEEFLNKDELLHKEKIYDNSNWNKTSTSNWNKNSVSNWNNNKTNTSNWNNNNKTNTSNWNNNNKTNTSNWNNNIEKKEILESNDNKKWVQEVSRKKKYDNLPENFSLRDLKNKYVIPIGKKSNSKYKSENSEENFIRAAQKRLHDAPNVNDAIYLCRDLADEYNKKHNVINGSKYYTLDELNLYIICIYMHMLVKNDRNDVIDNLFIKLEENYKKKFGLDRYKTEFLNTRQFIIASIWNGYTPIQNAAFYLSSNCIDNLILWGANIDETNIDNETLDQMLDAGLKYASSDKQKSNNFIFRKNAYNAAKEKLLHHRKLKLKDNNNVIKQETINDNNFDMNTLINELENYQSDELFTNFVKNNSSDNNKSYNLIVAYLTTIDNTIKINVFKDWFEKFLDGNMSKNDYSILIRKLFNEKHISKELLSEIFNENIIDYVQDEAPLVYKEIMSILN